MKKAVKSMHEMSIAQNIVEIIQQSLPPEQPPGSVRSVKLRVGEMAGIVIDSLKFCFGIITKSTPLAGAALDIEPVALMAECRSCGTTSKLEYGLFYCPSCGSTDLMILSGSELQVVAIELNDDMEEETPT